MFAVQVVFTALQYFLKFFFALLFFSYGAFRLDAKQRKAKVGDLHQPSRVVGYVVANLHDRSLHRLI